MDTAFLAKWGFFLVLGIVIGGAIGLVIDSVSLASQRRKMKTISMLINYIDIGIEILLRFLSLPVALLAIQFLNTIVPGGPMKSLEGFGSFIVKLAVSVGILILAMTLKIPTIAKPNEMERINTRGGALLGALVATGYFCYTNIYALKQLFAVMFCKIKF
jgi:hypothetical protein